MSERIDWKSPIHRWTDNDAQACVYCGQMFKKGSIVVNDVAVTWHLACAKKVGVSGESNE